MRSGSEFICGCGAQVGADGTLAKLGDDANVDCGGVCPCATGIPATPRNGPMSRVCSLLSPPPSLPLGPAQSRVKVIPMFVFIRRNFQFDTVSTPPRIRICNQDSQNVTSYALAADGSLDGAPVVLPLAGVCPQV